MMIRQSAGMINLAIRVRLALGVLLVSFLLISVRLWYLQVLKGHYFRVRSENNLLRTMYVSPPRGPILDRNGANDATLQVLDGLGPAGRDDLAGRDGTGVDRRKHPPGKKQRCGDPRRPRGSARRAPKRHRNGHRSLKRHCVPPLPAAGSA